MRPQISIIIPAYNAQLTIKLTLKSLIKQRFGDWEAVVVDDGSQDETVAIVQAVAAREPRIRLLRQVNAGVSAARNRGIDAAVGARLVFLDSDDTLHPDHLSSLSQAIAKTPGTQAAVCGYRRCTWGGAKLFDYPAPPLDGDAFAICANAPPVAIHAILVPRDVVVAVGKFDTTLRTNEDWDLWIRVARMGVRFAVVQRPLAIYRTSPGSLTSDSARMLIDVRRVADRALVPDPRLPDLGRPQPVAPFPLPEAGYIYCVFWSAGVEIGQGRDALALLDSVDWTRPLPSTFAGLARQFLEGLQLGAGTSPGKTVKLWQIAAELTKSFVDAASQRLKRSQLFLDVVDTIQREVALMSYAEEARLGKAMSKRLGLLTLLRGVRVPEGVDQIALHVPLARPRLLFRCVVPVLGDVSGKDIRAAFFGQFSERLNTVFRTRKPFSALGEKVPAALALGRRALRRLLRRKGPVTPPEAKAFQRLNTEEDIRRQGVIDAAYAAVAASDLPSVSRPQQEEGDWQPCRDSFEAWDNFYQTEDPWNYGSAYEQLKYRRTLDLIPEGKIGSALELACAEGRFTTMLAPRVEKLRAVDISSIALERAAKRCEAFSNIDYRRSDFFVEPIDGVWDVIICSEVLYYMASADEMAAFANRLAKSLNPGGYFIHAHAYQLTDSPERTGFDWYDPFGVVSITKAFDAAPGLQRVRSISTDLYRIDLYRQVAEDLPRKEPPPDEILPLGVELDLEVASHVVWNGAVTTRRHIDKTRRSFKIPVLMYHSISEGGPADLAPYRISPKMFETQLRFLRRRGFHSVTPESWDEAVYRAGSMRGRPVMLTFDDAFLDFYETAWPILARNGFDGHVFVPTGKIGGAADWDAEFGPPAPLMTWDHIVELANKGATFGSHMVSHRGADTMGTKEMLWEAATSRATLERVTGQKIRTIAPPFGAIDSRTEVIMARAGYTRMFADGGGEALIAGTRLLTPRVEIAGGDDMETFAAKLGVAHEPPEAWDEP